MKLSELYARKKPLDIDMGFGDMVHVDYRVHYLTGATLAKIEEINARQNDSKLRDSLDMLALLVANWDLTDDGGNMAPLDGEKLLELGMSADVANMIFEKVIEDMGVGEASATS